MTEEYTVRGGRLVVDRPDHKESIDLDLSTVENVSFTRGVWGEGALVLSTEDGGEYTVNVSNEDGPEAVADVRSGQSTQDDEPDLLDLIEEE